MKNQKGYFTGNLACQNLGDCSLCVLPVERAEISKVDEQNKKNLPEKSTILSRMLKKIVSKKA